MRPTRTLPLLALLCALLLGPVPTATGEEAGPPEPKPAPANAKKRAREQSRGEARLAEARRAAEIGRALLSSDEAVRSQAVARLVARIKEGGDLGWFMETMSRATRVWADRHERLMEVWLHDAVHGSASERERAVRLLAALGEKAIRRLSLELRHAKLHAGAGAASGSKPQEAAGAEEMDAPQQEIAELATKELAVGTPRVYELRDLFARGMNPLELRGLLLKTADAVEVKQYKTVFVVTAQDKGHALLCDRLHDLRISFRLSEQDTSQAERPQQAEPVTTGALTEGAQRLAAKRDAPAPPQAGAVHGDALEEGPPQRGSSVKKPAATGPTPKKAKTRKGKPETTSSGETSARTAKPPAAGSGPFRRAWEVEPSLLHLPRTALVGMGAFQRAADAWSKLPRGLFQHDQDVIRTTDLLVVDAWTKALKRVPEARSELPLRAVRRVPSHGDIQLFAGKEIHYSKSVRRTKGGAWSIVTDTIPHGITLELTLGGEATALRVDVVATKTEVGLPIPVVRVQPSAQATPVELECPEWSTTRVRRSFDLPLQGGGALVSLDGLGSTAADHLVLVLRITHAPRGK